MCAKHKYISVLLFWQLHRNQRILAKRTFFVVVNFPFKSFSIEKVIEAKASTQSNQFVLTTRCCKLSSKGIQFGKGKHLLNCSHYFEEHTLLKLQMFTLTVIGKPSTHFLYRFLDGKKTTRSQFSVPGLREIHRNLKP